MWNQVEIIHSTHYQNSLRTMLIIFNTLISMLTAEKPQKSAVVKAEIILHSAKIVFMKYISGFTNLFFIY